MLGKRSKTGGRRELAAVVLAAGEGKRMRSTRPKVMHELAGKPLLLHVLDALEPLRPDRTVVVVGKGGAAVEEAVAGRAKCIVQEPRLGTGHALAQALKALRGFRGDVLVLCGDVPLLRTTTLRRFLSRHRKSAATVTVLSMSVPDPSGYGRVVRGDRLRIVEHADASREERAINEVNTGTYCFAASFLQREIGKLGRGNVQREYYLTDLVEIAAARGGARCEKAPDADEGRGVNSRSDLAAAELCLRRRVIADWMERGVTFTDPASVTVGPDVRIGRDCTIGPNVVLLGSTAIGEGTRIDGCARFENARVDRDVHVRWGVVAESVRVSRGARIGPFAHLRPGASLGPGVHVGNFVEVKNAEIGARSKANHLAYIGDAAVGRDANIGAGTITCNYDGFRKHRTVIGDRVQIGSDTQLVAPVTLAPDSYVAAGSTVTRDVPAWALALNDKRQLVRPGWVKAFRARAQRLDSAKKSRKKG